MEAPAIIQRQAVELIRLHLSVVPTAQFRLFQQSETIRSGRPSLIATVCQKSTLLWKIELLNFNAK